MKTISILFWISVAGIGVSFTGAVITAVKQSQSSKVPQEAPLTIPTPAY